MTPKMKFFLSALFFICWSFPAFCQINGLLIDAKTKQGIPYVNIWVANKSIGTTALENGTFILPELDSTRTLVFSAIGYETKYLSSDSIANEIILHPSITQLEEIVVRTSKKSQEMVIGQLKKSKIKAYFSCGRSPWIAARFFPFNPAYQATPYLKKIKVLAESDIKSATFLIRLYNVNNKGEPEGYLYNKNIYGAAKKGNKFTEISLSHLAIPFPDNGFFIAIEWLIIPSNKHEYTYTMAGSKKKLQGISYEPSIGTIPSETNENSWLFIGGSWVKVWDTDCLLYTSPSPRD